MKKSDKIISTILILAILIGGGYFAAKHFGLIGGSAATIEEPQDIETVEVWNGDWYQTNLDEEYLYKIDAMEESPATYFIGTADSENWQLLTLSQTDKETFDSTITKAPSNKVINCVTSLMKDTFNENFSCANENEKQRKIEEELGHMLYAEFLIDNNVEIKCDSVTFEKIAAWDSYIPYCPVEFICIGTAEVTTIKADGDISKTPFGNEGETVTVKFNTGGLIQQYSGYTAKFYDDSATYATFFERVD